MTLIRVKWILGQIIAALAGFVVGGSYGFALFFTLCVLVDIRVAVEEMQART